MTAARRLAIATRSFRGTFNVNNYINETLEIDEGEVGVSIMDTIRLDTVEQIGIDTQIQVVSVDVNSIESLQGGQSSIDVEATVQSVGLDLEESHL